MKWSFKIGSVGGIDIKLHFTFVLVIIWAAAQGVSGFGGLRGGLFAVISILLLFACVTLHELGHSLVARGFGLHVRDITLLPIGGLAQLDTMPDRPLHELLIALAGPAVNLVIVVLLSLVVLVTRGANLLLNPGYLSRLLLGTQSLWSLLLYLLSANLILALFNLIPAFPMDGGRVLRAFLAMWTNYPRATRIATRLGQVMAVGLALMAFSPFGSVSLALVALFVFTGASYENQLVQTRAILRGLRVRHALPTRSLQTVTTEDTLTNVLEMSYRFAQLAYPVMQQGVLVGILSRDDLLAAFQRGDRDVRVAQMMRREFPVVSPDDMLLTAQQLIAQTGLVALPVFDRGLLVGLISLEDVNRAYANLSWRRR